MWKRLWRLRWSYAFLALPLFFLTFFTLIPTVWAVLLSFQQWSASGFNWVGLNNFARTFSDGVFWKSALNTFYYSLGVVPGGLLISLFLSFLIYPLHRALGSIFKAAFYLPSVASGAVMSVVWIWIFDPTWGVLNHLLNLVGLKPLMWLGDMNLALVSLILVSLASGQGASIILICASMGSIPTSLYEAATIDGCGRWRQFFRITIPLVKPTILYLMVINTVHSFQVFTQIYMMTGGGPFYATTTVVHQIYANAFQLYDYGKASVEGVLLLVVLLALAFIQNRSLGSDVEY